MRSTKFILLSLLLMSPGLWASSPLTRPAQAVVTQLPEYPTHARELGVEGVVLLQIDVEESGEATYIKVHNEQSHPLLSLAAVHSVRQWQFKPAMRNGKAVKSSLKVPIRFQLEAGEWVSPSRAIDRSALNAYR